MAKPMPLITYDEHMKDGGSFVLHETACAEIAKIKEPIYVVAVAGLYRTGKSFLLNQLASKTNGFDIGSSVEPCTQGIWMWIVDANQDGTDPALSSSTSKRFKLLLLDTEGLGSYTKNETYDVQIFSLALLLSSMFCYNSLGSIDETALDRLSLVVELSKHIQANLDTASQQDPYQLKAFFPAFMWVVRDFSLELNIGGKQVSAREYLENALLPAKGEGQRVVMKNNIRKAITEFFPDRDCFTIKRPVATEEQLQNLAKMDPRDFRPEFLKQMLELKATILGRVKPKTLYGEKLTGPMLVELARSYVEAINEGAVPTIRTAWENVVQMQCQKAVDTAKQLYTKRMATLIEEEEIPEADSLEEAHNEASWEAYLLFRHAAVGETVDDYELILRQFIVTSHEKFREENRKNSERECDRLLHGLVKDIGELMAAGQITTVEQLEEKWDAVIDKFQRVARGPAKHQVLQSYIAKKPLENARKVASGLVANVKDSYEKRLKEEGERAKQQYGTMQEMFNNVNTEWKQARESNSALARDNKNLEDQIKKLEKNERDLSEKVIQLEATLKAERMNTQTKTEENERLKKALAEVEKTAHHLKDNVVTKKRDKEAIDQAINNQKKKNCIVM